MRPIRNLSKWEGHLLAYSLLMRCDIPQSLHVPPVIRFIWSTYSACRSFIMSLRIMPCDVIRVIFASARRRVHKRKPAFQVLSGRVQWKYLVGCIMGNVRCSLFGALPIIGVKISTYILKITGVPLKPICWLTINLTNLVINSHLWAGSHASDVKT